MYAALVGAKGKGGSQGEISGVLAEMGYKIEEVYK